jgi:hypothetical protein
MLETILIALFATALVATVVAIVFFDEIVDWFRSRNGLKQSDRDNVAFTLKENLSNGQYKVVRGIFNTRTSTILDAKAEQTRQLDAKLRAVHGTENLVVYE